jgi:hypothetical protein
MQSKRYLVYLKIKCHENVVKMSDFLNLLGDIIKL